MTDKDILTDKQSSSSVTSISVPSTNFMQVVPNSHFWTSIGMMIHWLNYEKSMISCNHLLVGLRNTLQNGYDLVKKPESDQPTYTKAQIRLHLMKFNLAEHFIDTIVDSLTEVK